MNVDPNGKIAWWIVSALVDAALNASILLSLLLTHYHLSSKVKLTKEKGGQ